MCLQDIFKHCTEDGIMSVTEIPYFEGDFWPNIIEDTIKELDQEAREREASEAATNDVRRREEWSLEDKYTLSIVAREEYFCCN